MVRSQFSHDSFPKDGRTDLEKFTTPPELCTSQGRYLFVVMCPDSSCLCHHMDCE